MFDEFGNPIDQATTGGDFPTDVSDPGSGGSGGLDIGGMGGMMPVGLFGGSVASPGRSAIAGMYGAGRAAGRAFGSIMIAGGRSVTVKRAWEVAKKYGPEVAAAAVGMGVADLMAVFASSGVITSSSRRRRRGISARDIRCTKRVVHFVNKMAHDIGCVRRPHFRSKHASA